jgi:multiple sugar transport system permease protein
MAEQQQFAAQGTARSRPLLYHAILCLASIAMLYPLLWMLASSFKPDSDIFGSASLWPQNFSLDAYWRGWSGLQVSFGKFFLNSLLVSSCCVIGNVISCSLTAYAFARLNFRGQKFWFALMLGTLMLPYHVTLIPQYILFLNLGWVELDEAAMIDGCGPWRIYWTIILPLSVPALATAAIFTFIWTWDDFFGPLVYLNDMNSYTVQLGLRSFIDSTGKSDWSALFAMSTLTLLPVFALFLFFQRLLIDGIATTGLKG